MPYSVPDRRVTTRAAGPGCFAGGLTAVISWSETTRNDRAGADPKRTPTVEPSPQPLMVTCVPPASGPARGEKLVTPTDAVAAPAAEPPAETLADPAADAVGA